MHKKLKKIKMHVGEREPIIMYYKVVDQLVTIFLVPLEIWMSIIIYFFQIICHIYETSSGPNQDVGDNFLVPLDLWKSINIYFLEIICHINETKSDVIKFKRVVLILI